MTTARYARGVFAVALAGAAIFALGANDAQAQDKKVRLALASTYPGKMTQLGTLGIAMTQKLAKVSGGTIEMRFNEPGALVPALQIFDSISTGALDAGWSTPGYWTGKEIAFAMFGSVPFGPNAGEYMAWYYYGGGKQMLADLYGKFNIHSVICGVIAPEASGWFRKEIKTVEDLKGLKMRFFGLGANVMQKLGVSTQLIAGGEIYQALQLGTIDATEFSMPAIDLSLGFYQVAKHYYFPGWHQQSTFFDLMISANKWKELSPTQQFQVEMVCGDNMREGLAEGEAIQVAALEELKSKGVEIHQWSPEILAAMRAAWDEVVKEQSEKSAEFKKVWDSYAKFRKNYAIWREIGYLKN